MASGHANGVRELANTSLERQQHPDNPIVNFPTAVASVSESSMQLNWNAVSGASSYNVRYSANNGGPFLTLRSIRPHQAVIGPGQWRDLLLCGDSRHRGR